MRRFLPVALLVWILVLPLPAEEPAAPGNEPAAPDQPDPPTPGAAVRERTRKDAGRLLPQRGLGGDESARLTPGKTTWVESAIEVEGCEKLTAYASIPEAIASTKRCALFFMFHGNGDVGKYRVQNHARITTDRDPVIVCGIQYQELTPEGKGQMGLPPLAAPDATIRGCRWWLDKLMKEHPVDPERVFVGGFSAGTGYASAWCNHAWREAPDQTLFRGCFLYGSGGAASKSTIAPVVWSSMCGEDETAVLGRINIVEAVRHWSNALASWGIPVVYHEIPKMGHDVNARCLQITRDLVNELGGPGAEHVAGPAGTPLDPPPFPPGTDPFVKEICALCAEDRWPEAVARILAIDQDRKIPRKDKQAVVQLSKDIEAYARTELARLEKLLAGSIQAGTFANPCVVRRAEALLAAFEKRSWPPKKSLGDKLTRLRATDYPAAVRDVERERAMREAWALEAQGDEARAEARKRYEALAARAAEDGGASVWPQAARWRLRWWQD